MTNPVYRSAFGPGGWLPFTGPAGEESAGAWIRVLRDVPVGDQFSLVLLEPGSTLAGWPAEVGMVLVLAGQCTATASPDVRRVYRAGAYRPAAELAEATLRADDKCQLLLITGEHLGDPVDDVFSPRGWASAAPGLWSRPLTTTRFKGDYEERVVGLAHFEAGGSAGLHAHPTVHNFLFLDGDAEDEIVFPDGSRQLEHRTRGDFVAYPYPIEHRTVSATGCLILFVHEPVCYLNAR